MAIRVLIADDHTLLRSGLRALLEREADIEVVGEAGTGPDTLRAIAELDADVLVLDLGMPGLSGAKVAETTLRDRRGPAIVVLTMHQDEYYLQELLKIGVHAFVLKKSTGTDLLQAIRAAHRGEQYIDTSLAGHVISSYVGRTAKNQETGRLAVLSPREREVCELLAYGHTNAEIAQKLSISERTVETHRMNLMAKLDLHSRAQLVRFAIDHGLLKIC
ncbi:MAG: response regulator [Planctomycetota bacterium]|jgi:DNA-binding NarL/FixJ family response regulator